MTKEGVLTCQMVEDCVSYLGRGGPGLQPMYQHLSLPSQSFSDISVLCSYIHLQKLEVPQNKIADLSCVSHMPYLVILDASHNEITDFFGFKPPKNLKEVNLSHNRMTKMKDLSAYLYLSKLDLGYNSLTEITGLEKCCSLTVLNLEHNQIFRISGLSSLPLTHLSLRGNQLEQIEGLDDQKSLQVLDLSSNRIVSMSGLQSLQLLCSLNLEKNLISGIQECKHIHDLHLLRELKLMGNPVQEEPDYRLTVIFLLQQLSVLDQDKVRAEEKVTAVNKYDPPMEVVAARDHITQLVYQLMQPQLVYDSTLPSADSPYPMLVLTGPQGCGKRELTHRLCQEFCEFFAYGTSHTTREPYYGEENGVDYHFVSEEEFQISIHMGRFIQTMHFGGHRYGLSRDAIEDVAREGLACCVHMEIEGVLGLKKSYFEPRYVLLLPTQVDCYTSRLRSRGLYSTAQIEAAAARVDLYTSTNQQRPGFFDSVIPCNDLEEAYQMLKRVVNDCLLLEEKDGGGNDDQEEPTSSSTSAAAAADADPRSGDQSEGRPPPPPGSPPRSLPGALPSTGNYLAASRAEPSSAERSPAELASIRRREQLVREAIAGKSPGVYSQLFARSAPTAAAAPPENKGSRASTRALPQKVNEDVSSAESRTSSALSLPSSAGVLSALAEPLDVGVLGHALDSLKEQTLDSDQPSSIKAVLPPIPTGRRTPAQLPTPAQSPRLSSSSTVAEGGDPDTEG